MKLSKALKHLFIPHEHNDYKPHFFREISVALLIALVMFLLGLSAGSTFFLKRTVLGASVSSSVLIDLTNESRLANNHPPLVRNSLLDRAAELKAEDMVKEGYFAHTSPKGVTPWHWFREVGYLFAYAGENLAVNFTDARAVRDAWLASPKHKDNLLDVRFREIGMAATEGTYEGDPSIFIVQLFGTPAVLASTEKPAPRADKAGQPPSAASDTAETGSVSSAQSQPEVKGEEIEMVSSAEVQQVPAYSTWLERIVFGGSYYVQILYISLFIFVLGALLLMIVVEIRRQHWKHIVYGLSVLLVITLSSLINMAFF